MTRGSVLRCGCHASALLISRMPSRAQCLGAKLSEWRWPGLSRPSLSCCLLDEPLAALDAKTHLLVRTEVRRHLADFSGATLLVTHDPIDASVLADRLIVIEHGRVVQQGTPLHVARRPRTDYVARLVGLNLLAGRGEGHRVLLPSGGFVELAEPVSGRGLRRVPAGSSLLVRTPSRRVPSQPVGRPPGHTRAAW